jgi:hypothetical protein
MGDAAEQAYRRGDALEKRRGLMEDWGDTVGEMCSAQITIDKLRLNGTSSDT